MGGRFEDGWRSRFEEFAELSDDDAGIAGWSRTGLDARVRRFVGLWDPGKPGSRWLDAGCGAGTYTRLLVERGHDVVAADYSLPTLRKAIAREISSAQFIVADVRWLPFRTGAFDGVLCLGVTQALTNSTEAVRELARLVRPGGELWIDALNRGCIIHVVAGAMDALRGQSRRLRYESSRRMKRMLQDEGFADVSVHWMPISPRGVHRLQRALESRLARWLLAWMPFFGLLVSHAFIVHARKRVQA